jgi:hypothetical protein
MRPTVTIASPHRYPDLARLWYRSVKRDLVPRFKDAGWDVRVCIYCDGPYYENGSARFPVEWFAGAELRGPEPAARDFVEFYDAALRFESDYVFFVDADVFFTDASIVSHYLSAFDDPEVAAISFLKRAVLPGVYALLCRCQAYLTLGSGALAATYEGLAEWPDSVNRGPGERAAERLAGQGKCIIDITPDAQPCIADFHGTTVLRVSREMFASEIGEEQFEDLIAEKRYFCMGAYDNLLLDGLYRSLFGCDMPGSVTAGAFRAILERVPFRLRANLSEYFERSDRAIERLARREGISLKRPLELPDNWLKVTAA